MKRIPLIAAGLASLLLLASSVPSFAAHKGKQGKETKITGEAKCAKCALKEADTCQTSFR